MDIQKKRTIFFFFFFFKNGSYPLMHLDGQHTAIVLTFNILFISIILHWTTVRVNSANTTFMKKMITI